MGQNIMAITDNMKPSDEKRSCFAQQADEIVNIGKAENVNINRLYVMTGLPSLPTSEVKPVKFSRDYYNLIVYGEELLNRNGHITMEKRNCLVEDDNITPELKARFSPLTPEAIEKLKTFPCIITCENRRYGWTDEDHYASIAQLTEIKNRSNGIELYFHPLCAVPQARLNELSHELGICGSYKKFNELDHTHWTVKEIDLCKVLSDAGLNIIKW